MGLPYCGDIYVCEALRGGAGGGGTTRERKGRGHFPALSSSIPDFCFPAPEMQFEPIKSMVSGWFRGRSGGGRAESMRNFESGGACKITYPIDGECIV